MDRAVFGSRVRARRRSLGLSQAALAAAVSVSQPTIHEIEFGFIRGSRSTRERIEAFLAERERSAASASALAEWRRKGKRGRG